MLCGTDPLPELFRAKRYKIHQKFLSKADFQLIMRNLPVEVTEEEIEDMFAVADTDKDGKLGYKVLCYLSRYGVFSSIQSCNCTVI